MRAAGHAVQHAQAERGMGVAEAPHPAGSRLHVQMVVRGGAVDVRRVPHAAAAPQRPEADANQRGADNPFTPRRNRFDWRQQIPQQHRQGGDDDDAGGVADTPGPAGHPAAAAAVDGERADCRQMIGARQYVKRIRPVRR